MLPNDEVRQMLLAGAHESDQWVPLFELLGRCDLFACFVGDPMGNPQAWSMELQPSQVVLPVFTHVDLLTSNVPCPAGSWPDEVGIRQAASLALSKGWLGVYVNYRGNGWLIQGDLLSAAALGQLPAA